MKKRKILSLLTVFIIIFTLIPSTITVAAGDNNSNTDITTDTVVGLGLIGGSLCKAIKKHTNHHTIKNMKIMYL